MDDDSEKISGRDSVVEIEAPNDVDISREPLCEVFSLE